MVPIARSTLPRRLLDAVLRGIRGKCPRCDGASLFHRWLKPVEHCHLCGQDWTPARADDIPPYISIFLTGHILAPVMILLVLDMQLSVAATLAIILPLAIVLMLAILQPAKGGVMAAQWWLGLGDFEQQRPLADEPGD